MSRPVALLLTLLFLPPARAQTPNAFFARGAPTIVRGTKGPELSAKANAAQAELLRSIAFPSSTVVADKSIDVEKGVAGWPANPVLIGSGESNAVLEALGDRLPFQFRRGGLEIGGQSFTGADVCLIACIPAQADAPGAPGWPELVVYAGASPLEALELNSVRHGTLPVLVVDKFGALAGAEWKRDDAGKLHAAFGPAAKRVEWRRTSSVDRASPRPVFVSHLASTAASPADNERSDAVLRGVERAAQRLGIDAFDPISVFVYPDKKTKGELTGNPGDGHAVPAARALHVIACDAEEGGALEDLVAHESTHVLAPYAIAPASSPVLGEGLAVWTSGKYQGRALAEWKKTLAAKAPTVAELLHGMRKLPEDVAYPLSGLLVEALVRDFGWDAFKEAFAGAGESTWTAACKTVGSTPEKIEELWRKSLGRK